MNKHTEGPWNYLGDSLTHRMFDIYHPGEKWKLVCTVNNLPHELLILRDPAEAEANARLISAAPDMLAALQKIASTAPAHIASLAWECIEKATGNKP